MHSKFFLPMVLSLFICAGTYADETPWMLEQDEQRIQIYTRPVTGSPFVEVKATTLINAPIAHVATFLGDGNDCGGWRPMCRSSEVIDTVSETERVVYLVMDMPWPLSDRDMVVQSTVEIDPGAENVTVQLRSASSKFPEQDYVRMTTNGQYQLKSLGAQQVEFTYIMHTDLGGDLSADLINPRVAASTFDDVKRLQILAEQ